MSLIGRRPEIQVIAEASNGREAVEQYFARRPDVALLDLRMPIMDEFQPWRPIFKKEPKARIRSPGKVFALLPRVRYWLRR